MHIRDLTPDDLDPAAQLLVAAFAEHWPDAWPTLDAARDEVREALADGHILRAARLDDGALAGWIGGMHGYARVWELHPLAVAPAHQGRGIGRALVADLEAQVAARGGLTLMLGSDDEAAMTTLAGLDLYPDPLAPLAQLANRRRHPFEFYQRCGYAVIGVVPDANGFGKPDILMARRVGRDPDPA